MTQVLGSKELVRKRDGRLVDFDEDRIINAILKAMDASGEGTREDAERVSNKTIGIIAANITSTPTVENIQDAVEKALMLLDFDQTAKKYILYRHERETIRSQAREIPDHVIELASYSKNFFENPLAEFVYYRSYSRWIEEEGRRETWVETVTRYMNYMYKTLGDKLRPDEYDEVKEYILNMWALPSMRLMWSAGEAADHSHVTAYNCSYVAISRIVDFGEILYLSMSGCGVGFSVEDYSIQHLPIVELHDPDAVPKEFTVADSKEGWADALIHVMIEAFSGHKAIPLYHLIRPAGERLKTMGGRAGGPDTLKELLEYVHAKIRSAEGRRLTEIEVHDISCKIGEVAMMGGVRRTAMISISSLTNRDMRFAKFGFATTTERQREVANNSVGYNQKPTQEQFMGEWLSLVKSRSGERGIFNRGSLAQQIPSRRLHTIDEDFRTVGTNPCGEIILKSRQFCNLTEVVARPTDTRRTLSDKIRIATILGTYQSMLTNFAYLSPEWKKNCEQERLLGVSVTGQWDSGEFRKIEVQRWAKAIASKTNAEYADRFGISRSVAITCVKPSGTVSQLTNSSSGIHPRYAKYYIRRIRISASESLFHMMRDQKFPYQPEVGQTHETAVTFVVEFPVKAPDGAITRHDVSAKEQLEYWKQVKEQYTEHNPSCTVYVADDEWLDVAYWVWNNWDIIGGLAFLPRDDHVYRLAPYEEISEDRYNQLVAELPEIDFSQILAYEKDDRTEGSKELACIGDKCDI